MDGYQIMLKHLLMIQLRRHGDVEGPAAVAAGHRRAMAGSAAASANYLRLLPALLACLIYVGTFSRFGHGTPGGSPVKWETHPAANVPASASLVTSVTHEGILSRTVDASGEGDSSIRPRHAASAAAIAAAAQQPVVIGLRRSGQWPFWQAMQAPARLSELGVRAATNMQGPAMDAQHPDWHELNCSYLGVPIDCVFTINTSRFAAADGMYHHTPSTRQASDILPRQHPRQIRFAVSLESAAYYSWINQPEYMCNFESEATYRSCSQVQSTMHHETQHDFATGANLVHAPELSYEQKQDGVAYINSNCFGPSGRAQLMEEWLQLPHARTPVHAFGACSNNRAWPREGGRELSKRQVFQRYKFCVAMENSISFDYITEKVWDALSAGCVPIYRGSPNVLDIMPEPQAVILYGPGGNASTVQQLDALLADISADRSRYEAMLAWKHKPVQQLSRGYQRYLAMLQGGTNECRMCAHIVQRRVSGDFSRAATCLWNQTWLERAGQAFTNASCHERPER